jgi:hypothetical protein
MNDERLADNFFKDHVTGPLTSLYVSTWNYFNNEFGLGPLACSDTEFDFWNLWINFGIW